VTVVRLGAWCDFVTEDEYRERLLRGGWAGPAGSPGWSPVFPSVPSRVQADSVEDLVEDFKRGVSFVVHEFADLADGRRITLHEERGFTTSAQWRYLTLDDLERDVRTTVLPDDDYTQDEHPWEWLAGLLHALGVQATAEELRLLLYSVEFSERLRARLEAEA
jgi:hypothetical protein